MLVVAEGGNEGGGVSTLHVRGGQVEVKEVAKGFDQVATLALFQSSAWVVENQGDHFWSPDESGRDATPPFRVVEVPLTAAAGARTIEVAAERFFPEGVTLDDRDNFYVGSMSTGAIHKARAAADKTERFIAPNAENGLVSDRVLQRDRDRWRGQRVCDGLVVPAHPAFARGRRCFGGMGCQRCIPQDQWHLNGIDIDRRGRVVYVVENHPGGLYAIPIERDGTAGPVRAVATSRPLYAPDGLKVLGPSLLAVA